MTKQHPDAAMKVGTKREGAGLTWTLYKNQFGLAWKAGALAHSIRLSDMTPSTHTSPYRIGGIGYATFEKATAKASALMLRDYRDARTLVKAYEEQFAELYPDNKDGPK